MCKNYKHNLSKETCRFPWRLENLLPFFLRHYLFRVCHVLSFELILVFSFNYLIWIVPLISSFHVFHFVCSSLSLSLDVLPFFLKTTPATMLSAFKHRAVYRVNANYMQGTISAPDVNPRISYNRFASVNEKRSEMTLGNVFDVVCRPYSSPIQTVPPTGCIFF